MGRAPPSRRLSALISGPARPGPGSSCWLTGGGSYPVLWWWLAASRHGGGRGRAEAAGQGAELHFCQRRGPEFLLSWSYFTLVSRPGGSAVACQQKLPSDLDARVNYKIHCGNFIFPSLLLSL